MELQDKPQDSRIVIHGILSETAWKNKAGEWEYSKKGFSDKFKFERQAGTMVGSLFQTGKDKDGQWVEQQLFYCTRKDSDTIIVYWFRGVDNIDLPLSNSHIKWARLKVGELKKVK